MGFNPIYTGMHKFNDAKVITLAMGAPLEQLALNIFAIYIHINTLEIHTNAHIKIKNTAAPTAVFQRARM